jgi:insecticidal toxin complex protein TccC
MPDTLYTGTPTIMVRDNRGLTVRTLQYNREKLDSPLDERITAMAYSPAGVVQRQTDPRLFAQSDPSVANFNYSHDLLGHTLWTRSVDAGERWIVLNSESQPIVQQDARGTVTRTEYDSLGRLTQVSEQLMSRDPIVVTKLTYGDADNHDPAKKDAAQQANLCGVVSQQCDTAGQLTTPGMTVTGQPQAQLRRLLKATQGEADWGAAIPPDLEIDAYTTTWAYNALGQPLTQTDAMSNVQQSTYDVAGRLALVKLKQKQDTNFKTLLASIQYSAQGQLEREVAGNGVTTTYTYDPKTLRLMQSQAKDSNGTVRQQLAYEYDPVGNIVSIEDQAIAPAFFNNEQIQAKATYAYDSLYQLVRATGREQTDAQQSSQLPPLIHPPSPGTRTNYTRTYTYNRGGNLIGIRGERGSRFTQTMTIAHSSNRLAAVTGSGLQVGNTISSLQYDANGNPGALGTKVLKQLQWDGRNQLRHVVMLERTGGAPNDEEWYQYDGNGQRIRKTTSTLAKQEDQSQHTDEVIYLPGLQLRRRFNVKNDVVEELHIVTVQAGRAQVRVLHWNKGQPDKIENNQIRYSLDNHLGSSVMELDQNAQLLTYEEYYPYGGTAVWAAKSELEAKYKFIRYSGKERDATGLYYYGFRYYAPWLGRWLNPDPAGIIDGLNLYGMVKNNPVVFVDQQGFYGESSGAIEIEGKKINYRIENKKKGTKIIIGEKDKKYINYFEFSKKRGQSTMKPGFNIPSELFEQKSEKKDLIFSFKKELPVSCIQSTEYGISILYGNEKPFDREAEAEGNWEAENIDIMARYESKRKNGNGQSRFINISSATDLGNVENLKKIKKEDEGTLGLPTLGEGIMMAARKEPDVGKYPFHFGAAISAIFDENNTIIASIVTDLSEDKRDKSNRLPMTKNVQATFLTKAEDFRGSDYPKEDYSIVRVFAQGKGTAKKLKKMAA